MAIDTAKKRRGECGTRRLPWFRRFQPAPDGTITRGDRRSLAFVYPSADKVPPSTDKWFLADARFGYSPDTNHVEYYAVGTYGVTAMADPTFYVVDTDRYEETVDAGVCDYTADGRIEYGVST